MAKKHLRLDPHTKSYDFWWYELNYGICICTRIDGKVETHNIPWRSIRAALKRKDKI